MADSTDDEARLSQARRTGRRAGFAVALVVSVWFVASSTWQITRDLFGFGTIPLAPGAPGSPERTCAVGVDRLALGAPWIDTDGIAHACEAAEGGLDAWAALLRLKAAEEQLGRNSPDLGPLRDQVHAHLPADLR